MYFAVDGAPLRPRVLADGTLQVVVPAGEGEIRLVSPRLAPGDVDVRRLDVVVSRLAVSDGSGWREIALDDPGLFAGFHEIERETDRS